MKASISDCCVKVAFDADILLVISEGEFDPIANEEIGWPFPRVYWSNGLVSDGVWNEEDEDE